MRVMYVNAVCGVGSTGKIIADLMGALREKGHIAKIAFGVGDALGVPEEDAIKIGGRGNYYLHNALSRLTDHAGLYSYRSTIKLIEYAERFNPDIFHVHNLHGYYVNYKMLFEYLSQTKKPVVMTLHDCWSFTGHCTHFCQVGCDQWKSRCERCALLHRYPSCLGPGDVGFNFDCKKKSFSSIENLTIVTPSAWLADLVKQSFLGDCDIEVIPNGIDASAFKKTNGVFRDLYDIGDDVMVLGVSNVWSEAKGFQEFLELAERLGDGYKTVLVGLEADQVNGLPAGLIGIERTKNSFELADIYSSADIFVNLSREDTSSMVNLEAQACGTRVVTYDAGGCAETLVPGLGISVPCGNLSMVEAAVKNRDEVFSAVSLEEILNKVDQKNAHDRYLSLYERVVSVEHK